MNNINENKIKINKKYMANVDIEGEIYTIVNIHEKKIYEPLMIALIGAMTPEQIDKNTIETKYNKKTIIYYDIIHSFIWTKHGDNTETETTYDYCICGHSIVYNYKIKNYDDGSQYIVGSTCINTHLLNLLTLSERFDFIRSVKSRNDEPNTERCLFCYRNTTKKSCNNCKQRKFCKSIIDKWKSKIKRHKCRYCKVMCDKSLPYCIDCKFYLDINKHPCIECSKWCDNKYRMCYSCSFENKHKCNSCNRYCDKKYEYCYYCKSK